MFSRGLSTRHSIPAMAFLATLIATAPARADRLAGLFPAAPPDSLVKGLQVTPAEAPEEALDGTLVQRHYRWIPEPGIALIESTLVNQSARSRQLRKVVFVDWTIPADQAWDSARYQPLGYRNDTWYGSTYWTGPDWTRVGKDWHHSGTRTSSIRRFVAPRDGRVSLSGRVYKADTNGGDGVRLEIRVGRQVVWQAEIDGNDRVGVEPKLTFEVRRGDAIRFVVHRRGEISFDTTHWDPTISYDNGQAFQASAGFSTRQQGERGWFFEMENDSDTDAVGRETSVHSFGRELMLHSQRIRSAARMAWGPDDSIPAWIVADGADKSGMVLAGLSRDRWQCLCERSDVGDLRIRLVADYGDSPLLLQPGESIRLPDVILAAYQGTWLKGTQTLQGILASTTMSSSLVPLRQAVLHAADRAGMDVSTGSAPEIDLCAMVQLDWIKQDQLKDNLESYRGAVERHMEKSRELLADLRRMRSDDFLAGQSAKLDQLAARVLQPQLSAADWRQCYVQVRWLKRQLALANPLLDFGKLLFCKRVPTSYSHLVMQYYGWRARPGGGIFVLDRPGHSLACRDMFDGRLTGGNVLEPRLDFDGTRIVFSFVQCRPDNTLWDPPASTINRRRVLSHLDRQR